MTDTLVLKSGLKMPSSFVEVKDEEMEYVDGGIGVLGIIGAVVAIVAGMVAAIIGCINLGEYIGRNLRNVYGVNISGWSWWQKALMQAGISAVAGLFVAIGVMNVIAS